MLLESFNFSNSKILIIGDVMLDEYWIGEANRISPEAPVPIVLVEHTNYRAGGAANVALNAAAFGCKIDLLGLVGDDSSSKTLNAIINQIPNCNSLLISSSNQPTINKLRIISNNQQLFRLDKEEYFSKNNFELLITKFKQAIANNNYNLIVLSDYGKGSLQDPQIFINYANKYNIPIIVDPKNPDCSLYKNATLLTPNFKEFQSMVNTSWHVTNANSYEQEILEKGHNLIKELNLKALIITRGKHGLTVLTSDYKDQHFASSCHEVFDVTGAGDTVTATIAAYLASGKELHIAAHIATIAAGIVVSKLGTSTITIKELNTELQKIDLNKELNLPTLQLGIIEQEPLKNIIMQRKLLGETIVLVNGCFDIIHAGHISYLEKAKSFGTRLIVAVNDDSSIKMLKGKNRPINCLQERMQVLAGLKAVDWVVPFSELRPGDLIKYLNPSILVKTKETFKTIEDIPETEGVKYILDNGGKVYLLDRPLIPEQTGSSSKIIEAIKNTFTIDREIYDT